MIRRRSQVLVCALAAWMGTALLQDCSRIAASGVPTVSAVPIGAEQLVFDTRHACELIDIPDAPARAFRDYTGTVHLIATHWVARAMLGPDLDHLRHDCKVIYLSPKDTNPAHFRYNNWLYSFYSLDGRRIAALVHSEFDAEYIPGMCATPDETNNCWWNTITFAESEDGGYSFHTPSPPANLVAAVPWPYVVGNRASAYGYNAPSNIVKFHDFYYALINDWPYKSQRFGPCLIRTQNVFDASSWRAWNGKNYSVRFVNPYSERSVDTDQHVCAPVLAGTAGSLVYHAKSGIFLVTQYFPNDSFGPPGLYIQGSRDLVNWSSPHLIVTLSELRKSDGPGNWNYDYVSLIDPNSADRNFTTVDDTPNLYYVRFDSNHPPYVRALISRRIRVVISTR